MRLTIRTKLLGGFAVILVLMVALAVVSIGRLDQAAERTQAMYRENVLGVQYALLTNQNMIASAREEKRAFLEPPGADRDALIAQSRDAMRAAEQAMLDYEQTFASEEDRQQWMAVTGPVRQVIAERTAVLDLLADGHDAEALEAAAGMFTTIVPMNQALEAAGDFNAAIAGEAVDVAASAASQARWLLVGVTAVAVAVSMAGGLWLSRSISGGVGQMKAAAEGIARGELDQNVTVDSRDEIGDMARAFTQMQEYLSEMAGAAGRIANGDLTVQVQPQSDRDALGVAFARMTESLNDFMHRARRTADELSAARAELESVADEASRATTEVARSSSQVAEGTGQQAEAVQQISESVTTLSEHIDEVTGGAARQAEAVENATRLSQRLATASQQMASGASTAASGAREASSTAADGAARVQATMEGITRLQARIDAASGEIGVLGERSQEIGKIVAVIEDIAAQTNLLALNAAIEAARAGDQGRGFAVVADEVRQLAERVASATKEIAELIDGVQAGVDASVRAMEEGVTEMQTGSEAASDADQALARIVKAVDEVVNEISQIAEGADDLRRTGEEMAQRIDDIGSVAAANREAAAAMADRSTAVTSAIAAITSVAEENSASTEEVSAAAEEMSAQVEELAASTSSLGRMADSLLDQIGSFRLRGADQETRLSVVRDAPHQEQRGAEQATAA